MKWNVLTEEAQLVLFRLTLRMFADTDLLEKCRGGLVNKVSQSNVSIDVKSTLLALL